MGGVVGSDLGYEIGYGNPIGAGLGAAVGSYFTGGISKNCFCAAHHCYPCAVQHVIPASRNFCLLGSLGAFVY